MALKRNKNGTYVVKTEPQAREALIEMKAISQQITALMVEHGIPELQAQADALKSAATDFCVANDVETIPLTTNVYARLRKDKYGGTWVSTDADLTEDTPVDVTPLRNILKKKFNSVRFREVWYEISKRVVDTEKLEKAVTDGTLTAEEIAPAFYEKDKKPFLIVYGKD